jgi:hypothetical protein
MDFEQALFALGFFAFCGGLIDAAVGGGGLVQLPALLHALPQYSLATVFGTNKLAVLAGNLSSIYSYTKRIKIVWKLMLPTMLLRHSFYVHWRVFRVNRSCNHGVRCFFCFDSDGDLYVRGKKIRPDQH